jgi:hypothetical protein
VKAAELSVLGVGSRLCADMSNGSPRHLAAPLPLPRRWRLWTGVGLAVLLAVGMDLTHITKTFSDV